MKKQLFSLAMAMFSIPVLASAQCPPGTNPNNYLTGATFAYRLDNGLGTLAIGRFTVLPGNLVQATQTSVNNKNYQNIINRLAPASGRVMVMNDCGSGVLYLNVDTSSTATEFKILNGGRELFFISGANGVAKRVTHNSCPQGIPPMLTVFGASWLYQVWGGDYEGGVFRAISANPFSNTGALAVSFRSVGNPNTNGIYQVYDNCHGGEIMIMGNGTSRQFEFVFSKSDFSEMFLLRDDLSTGNAGTPGTPGTPGVPCVPDTIGPIPGFCMPGTGIPGTPGTPGAPGSPGNGAQLMIGEAQRLFGF